MRADPPEVTPTELRAWYLLDAASSPYSVVVIGAYLPLLLQSVALQEAGFPLSCPNYEPNSTSQAAYRIFDEATDFFVDNLCPTSATPCTRSDGCRAFNGSNFCSGQPLIPRDCLNLAGDERIALRVHIGSWAIDPTQYATLAVSLSVLFQFVAFVSFGALGDFGEQRKRVLVWSTVLGAVLCILCTGVTVDVWWLGGVLLIGTNTLYGLSFLLASAWLPLLTSSHWDVLQATPQQRRAVWNTTLDNLSNRGYAWGYAGAVACLFLTLPFVFAAEPIFGEGESEFETVVPAFRVNIAIAGVWWLVISLYAFNRLEPRPGPPFPPSVSYLLFSWKRTWNTLMRIRELGTCGAFLAAWFVLSDGFFLLGSVGVLIANTGATRHPLILFSPQPRLPRSNAPPPDVRWKSMDRGTGIGILVALVPILAGLGNVVAERIERRFNPQPKRVVLVCSLVPALASAYGIVGFWTDDAGLRYGSEVLVIGALYGAVLGVMQSYCRAILASLTPPGYEVRPSFDGVPMPVPSL